MNKITPTLEEFKEFLSYDPETGVFSWIKPSARQQKAGQQAGTKTKKGYISISFKRMSGGFEKRSYVAHRLAWFYIHGRWPTDQIDHINGIRNDNRIVNLREVTNRENQQNNWRFRKGLNVGVNYRKDRKRWRAYINVNGKQKSIGMYSSEEEAAHARKKFIDENPNLI